MVEVCTRLEGIPLAIELAAARVRVMTAQQIASRLGDHLSLLAGGSREVSARQQTLRATLDWSYTLLSVQEHLLLGRLSAFAGGWTLEAAETVCSGRGIEAGRVLDLLTSLLDKSLVVFAAHKQGDGRYRLLETTRQYAAQHMDVSETARIRAAHRDYFLALAEEATQRLAGPEQVVQMARLGAEHENLRAALAWCEAEPDGVVADLRLTGVLWQFWGLRGEYGEGRRHLARALARGEVDAAARGESGTAVRAKALHAAAALACGQADLSAAQSLYQESLDLYRQLGDGPGIVSTVTGLGSVARDLGDYAAARVHYEEGLALARERGKGQHRLPAGQLGQYPPATGGTGRLRSDV